MKITHGYLIEYASMHFPNRKWKIRKRDVRSGGYAIYKTINKLGAITDILNFKNAGECLASLETMHAMKRGELK
jgi:hypothetical protein